MFDADGSADPAEIPAFVAALVDGASFAKDSRYAPGGGSEDLTQLPSLGNSLLNALANAAFGTHLTDLCYSYNAFWRDLVTVLDLPTVDLPAPTKSLPWGDCFEIETIISSRFAAARVKTTEVPSVERSRIHGRSNLRPFRDGARVPQTIVAEHNRKRRLRKRLQPRTCTAFVIPTVHEWTSSTWLPDTRRRVKLAERPALEKGSWRTAPPHEHPQRLGSRGEGRGTASDEIGGETSGWRFSPGVTIPTWMG